MHYRLRTRSSALFVRLICLLAAGLLAACQNSDQSTPQPATSESLDPALIALNNRGVAEMGRFEYAKAEKTFAELVRRQPDERLFRLNHLIALLNRQQPGDEQTALQLAEQLSRQWPESLQAPYIAGLLHFNAGRCEAALPYFEQVTAADPEDAYALYFAGQCLLQQGKAAEALMRFQQSLAADSYLRSAYYSAFMAAQQLGRAQEAEKLLADYQHLQANPQSRLAEIKYTRMGPKAEVKTVPASIRPATKPASLAAPFFGSPVSRLLISGNADAQQLISANLVDFAGNGQSQLVSLQPGGIYRQSLNTADTKPVRILALPGEHAFQAMAWGDVDNDGQVDVLLVGPTSQLWLGEGDSFRLAGQGDFGLDQPDWRNARLADADHDGDLDILAISGTGRFVLWNNNLDGSWRELNREKHIPDVPGVKQVLLADVDADRDVDIILRQQNGLAWLQNDRMWHYRLHKVPLSGTPEALAIADMDNNGLPDWIVATANGWQRLEWRAADRAVAPLARQNALPAGLPNKPQRLLLADISGNGIKEILVLTNNALTVFGPTGILETHALPGDANPGQAMLRHTLRGPEVMLPGNTGDMLVRIPATDNRAPFVLLAFTGAEDQANSVRSNKSGIGVRFTVFAGTCASNGETWQNHSASGQDAQSVSAACLAPEMDFIAIHWPDGVYQTEQPLATGRYYRFTETQRQLSSCPVIFLKNQGQYHFESDVLGVAGIGFALGKDEYGQPRPWENYLLEPARWSAENGMYSLLFTEPMEEAAYLDGIAAEAIDVPAGWRVLLDERMQTGAPAVTGQAIFYRQRLNPLQILRQDGEDVTALGVHADNRAIAPAALDTRFMGFADGEQTLTLTFEQIPEGNWVLLMRGWVEYGYSQTGFAAWQAGLRWQPPSIDVWRDGRWHTILPAVGYPAGMPRLASIPLGTLVTGAEKIRIRHNQELYLDELALVNSEQPPEMLRQAMPLAAARLFKLGFPQRSNGPQRLPDYDFSRRQPFWDTRYMQGNYTRLGDVMPLLEETDNALAIIGPGEAIQIDFQDNLQPVPPGWQRYFVLKFTGWAKDMDLMTKDGETLAPIPHNGPVSDRAWQLNQIYNVRFQHGR